MQVSGVKVLVLFTNKHPGADVFRFFPDTRPRCKHSLQNAQIWGIILFFSGIEFVHFSIALE